LDVRRAAKKDGNHNESAAHLRARGWSVEDCHRHGDGFPDSIVGRPGFACLIEWKMKGEKLTPKEAKVAERWAGPYMVAYSGEDAEQKLEAEWQRLCFAIQLRKR
jgi:hypothetical protein